MAVVAGLVLAAGLGTRFGGPKAEVLVGGVRLVDRAVSALEDASCTPVVAVVPEGVEVPGAVVVTNPDPARGMRSSLALGLAMLDRTTAPDAVVVLLADMPGIGADAVARVVSRWSPGRIAVARYDDRRGHPVVMSPVMWQAAIELAAPDEGARALLARDSDLVDEVRVSADPRDIDTPADLA